MIHEDSSGEEDIFCLFSLPIFKCRGFQSFTLSCNFLSLPSSSSVSFSGLTDEGEKETDEDSVKKSDLTDAASFFDREKKMRKITALALL